MSKLTVTEEEFHELLEDREIELDPPLSDEDIERMRYNRNREFYHPEMKYLEEKGAVEKYRTYAQATLSAHQQLTKIRFLPDPSEEDLEHAEMQKEILRTATIEMFDLLKPLLQYHEFWESFDLEFQEIDGDGLQQLEAYEGRPEDLHAEDAFTAAQEMRTVAVGVGFLYNRQEEVLEAMEAANYWVNEITDEGG